MFIALDEQFEKKIIFQLALLHIGVLYFFRNCKNFWFCLVVVEAGKYGYYSRGCEKVNEQNSLISRRCPLNMKRDAIIDGEGYKKCWCDTLRDIPSPGPCNDGPMTNHHPGGWRCWEGIKCEATEDCGEGGYCERTW